jgi:hypothetical protein
MCKIQIDPSKGGINMIHELSQTFNVFLAIAVTPTRWG